MRKYFLASLLIVSVLTLSLVVAFWPFSSGGVTGAAVSRDLVAAGLYPSTRATALSCTAIEAGASYSYKSRFSTYTKQMTSGCSNNVEKTYSCKEDLKTASVATASCSNGCDDETGTCAENPEEIWTCTDASDNGINPQTKGTAISTNQAGESVSQTDECLNTRVLREVSCAETGGAIVFNEIGCNDAGCNPEADTCIPRYPSCEDSDEKDGSGFQPNEAGKITAYGSDGTRTIALDVCNDAKTAVIEQACDGTAAKSPAETMNCGTNEVCELGRCIGKKCEDSDNGNDPQTRGTVTSHQTVANAEQPADVTATDFCLSEKFLLEFSCSARTSNNRASLGKTSTNNARIAYKLTNCRGGCLAGACQPVTTPTTA